jgi:hypothetical protein
LRRAFLPILRGERVAIVPVVDANGNIEFVYTIGLYAFFKHPELLVSDEEEVTDVDR